MNTTDLKPGDLAGWESAETCTWRERQWLDYRGGVQCTCDTYPETTSGPEEDCEIHGHPYEEWVKRAAEAEAELARAEIVKPGHVQVRVNDLDLGRWEGVFEGRWNHATRVAIRAANAISAQRAESTPPADEQDASATEAATYQCPWCSTDVTFSLRLDRHPGVGVMVWVAADGAHTCPPAQPDEPTEFGARVTVTDDLSVVDERWCRQHDGYWANEDSELMTWAYLCQRGTITLGWDE